ncbi:MAG: hypothetical protein ACI3VB_04610 [Oscillospiraceae bacterium]
MSADKKSDPGAESRVPNTPDSTDQSDKLRASQKRESSHIIRLLAAAYLIYLAYKIIKGVITGEYDGNAGPWLIAGGIVFILVAVVIAFFSMRAMIAQRKEELDDYYRLKSEEEAASLKDEPAEDDNSGDEDIEESGEPEDTDSGK